MPLKAKKTRTKRRQRLNSEARATDIRRGAMVSAWAIAGAPSELGGRSVSLPCGDDLLHVGFCALGALSEGSFEPRTVWTARALRSLCHCRRRAGRAELPRQLSWALELGGSGRSDGVVAFTNFFPKLSDRRGDGWVPTPFIRVPSHSRTRSLTSARACCFAPDANSDTRFLTSTRQFRVAPHAHSIART